MAQLDSASDSDSDGWRFESVWVRHFKTFVSAKVFFMLAKKVTLSAWLFFFCAILRIKKSMSGMRGGRMLRAVLT